TGDIIDCSYLLFSTLFFYFFSCLANLSPTRANVVNHVSFTNPPSPHELEGRTESDAFAAELFGEQTQPPVITSWTPLMLSTIKSEVRSASLNAIGSGMAGLLDLESFQSVKGKAAISKISDGIRLLADLHFRVSQSRRAFIVPSLNFLGKTASDAAPIDDSLFGSNFAEDANAAQTIEKVARKMARKPPQLSNNQGRQPAPQRFKQQRNQPLREIRPNQGNAKPPLHKSQATHRSKRVSQYSSRSGRSASRSRTRTRH
ncbi:hypothetical protein ALC57_05782, partial [Trachymyrmex cornetzi]